MTWSDRGCCSKGATKATLRDRPGRSGGATPLLNRGSVLLFEEILSPTTGLGRDADPARRCAVRFIDATPSIDPLTNTQVLEAEWSDEDALPFPLCLSAVVTNGGGQQTLVEPTIARGNVVLVDHGATIRNEPLVPSVVPATGDYRPALAHSRLTFQGPFSTASAAAAMQYDVQQARPVISLNGDGGPWCSQSDLLGSDAFSRDFVVEMQSDGTAHLRFGDGIAGRKPAPGASFTASYRRGSGTRGNVGAGAIARIVWTGSGINAVPNPIAAAGGRDPGAAGAGQAVCSASLPYQERAVTEADYAAMAERNDEVQHAAATFRWTGSWHTAFVTVDRKAGRAVDAPFAATIRQYLERYRMAGYDVEVTSPVFVPLDLVLSVCVKSGLFPERCEAVVAGGVQQSRSS